MYKVTYHLGRINKYVVLKFHVTLRSNKGIDSVQRRNYAGNEYVSIMGLYPSLTIEIIDEVKDASTQIWSTQRSVLLNRAGISRFIERSYELIEEFKTRKDLFMYEDKSLIVNKDAAWELRKVIPTEFGKTIMLVPLVVEDQESHVQYEGLSFMINELSNYALFTYDEYVDMIRYIDKLDFDGLGIHLLNTALLMQTLKKSGNNIGVITGPSIKIEDVPDTPVSKIEERQQPSQEETKWNNFTQTNLIPEI